MQFHFKRDKGEKKMTASRRSAFTTNAQTKSPILGAEDRGKRKAQV
jgi:hypothetical protein